MAALSLRAQALSTYRGLQRAQSALFAQDLEARTKARVHIREQFELNKHESDKEKIETLLREANDVRVFLEKGVVQVEQVGEKARVHLRPTTYFTKNMEPTDVFEEDMRWPHEIAADQTSQHEGQCGTERPRCAGCACE